MKIQGNLPNSGRPEGPRRGVKPVVDRVAGTSLGPGTGKSCSKIRELLTRAGTDSETEALRFCSAPSLEWLSRWAWRKAQLAVSLPDRYSVELATHGGRVEVHGVDGEVEARSRSG